MSASHLKIDFADVRSIVLYAHSPMEVVHESSFRHCISTCALPAVGVGGMPEKRGPATSGRNRSKFVLTVVEVRRKFRQACAGGSTASQANCCSRGDCDLRRVG